jgi:hypothetical protein
MGKCLKKTRQLNNKADCLTLEFRTNILYRTSLCITVYIIIYFIISGSAAQRGLWPPHSTRFLDHTHNDAPQSTELLWTSDHLVAETSTWQHTQQTNIHVPGGIRTHDRNGRAAADLQLRPRGQWGRRYSIQVYRIISLTQLVFNWQHVSA